MEILDRHRPRYHFSPDNWMNDLKPFFHNGKYHAFFQYNPTGAFWGNIHWGHAVSEDLIHWEELPIALAPDQWYDSYGAWTGCVCYFQDKYWILYTASRMGEDGKFIQTQAVATCTDSDLIHWEKHPDNPIIVDPPPGFGECWRDPQAWWDEGCWWILVGGEQQDGIGGAALLYRSDDLLNWEFEHTLLRGQTAETGYDFECPDFFPLGDKWCFLSSRHRTWWQIGDYLDRHFIPRTIGSCDGDTVYAAKTLVDDRGRRILFGWVKENRPEEEQKTAGWSGLLGLPRLLSLLPNGKLGQRPIEELKRLRQDYHFFEPREVTDGTNVLPDFASTCCELIVRFEPSEAEVYGISVLCKPDGNRGVAITYNPKTQMLMDEPLALAPDEPLTLRVYIDGSVIEVFANNRACRTIRAYPPDEDQQHVSIIAEGGQAWASVDAWELGD
ncbi:MAG: glycoside hydrolase family 32 protein [Phycisphaerae bacterium]